MTSKSDAKRRVSPKITVTIGDKLLQFLDNELGIRYLPEMGKWGRSKKVSFCIEKVKAACEKS